MNTEMKMIKFRFLQLFRFLSTMGWIYVLISIPILAILVLSMLEYMQGLDGNYLLLLPYLILCLAFHSIRNDGIFLRKINSNLFFLLSMEYALISLPFSSMLLILGYYKIAIFGHLGVLGLSFVLSKVDLKVGQKRCAWPLQFIPDYFFEWKSVIRKFNYKLILFWILGLIAASHPVVYFFFVLLFAAIIADTFKYNEGKELRNHGNRNLYRKLGLNSLLLLTFLVPHILTYLSFNPQFWYVILGILIYLQLIQFYCISYKYAHYTQYHHVYNELPVAIFILLCPVLPFSLTLIAYTFIRAKKLYQYA